MNVFSLLLILPCLRAKFASNPVCETADDCPNGFRNCWEVEGRKGKICVGNATEYCTGGVPDEPLRTCARQRDCSKHLKNYTGWCDFRTKFCCKNGNAEIVEKHTCPDRLTPLYGQEKCTEVKKGMVYSGKSDQKGGLCYKGYSCPPKVTLPHEMSIGRMTFRTNMDCSVNETVDAKYNFMFCHNATGNLWVIGQLNVNGDEVIKHWTQCELNADCGEGLVCVKEDLCRRRCYEDPTAAIDYDWIVVQLSAMFLLPLIFLGSIIFLTVKYLD